MYVDGYVIPLRKDKQDAYRKLAQNAGEIWMEHGALQYVECVGEDMSPENNMDMRTFPQIAGAEEGETVVFAFVTYKSREHRDEVNKKVFADPRLDCGEENGMPFDCNRMAYGGFESIVELKK